MRYLGDAPPPEQAAWVTLAVGEESGHWHEIEGVLTRALSEGGRGEVHVTGGELRVGGLPDRHTPIALPTGRYEFWVQREYVPETGGSRLVAD
jgi:hypothetical protein